MFVVMMLVLVFTAVFIGSNNRALFQGGERIIAFKSHLMNEKSYALVMLAMLLSFSFMLLAIEQIFLAICSGVFFALGALVTALDYTQKGKGAFENGISFSGHFITYAQMTGYTWEEHGSRVHVTLQYRTMFAKAMATQELTIEMSEREEFFNLLEERALSGEAENAGSL